MPSFGYNLSEEWILCKLGARIYIYDNYSCDFGRLLSIDDYTYRKTLFSSVKIQKKYIYNCVLKHIYNNYMYCFILHIASINEKTMICEIYLIKIADYNI